MNKLPCFVSAAFLISLGVGVAIAAPPSGGPDHNPGSHGKEKAPRTIAITVGTKDIRAVVADTIPSRKEGLLGWESISEDEGMLLDFLVPAEYAIHMQGMKFPIDAVWIDSQGVIKLMYKNIMPNSRQVYPSMFSCRYCLELKAGFCEKYGARMGQNIRFNVR